MTYKSINTFIDDLFAFVIKMPIMHRMACLRDDIIFFIFCYQRYKYKTDFTRVNEFGQCVNPSEDLLEERKRQEATAAVTNDAIDNKQEAEVNEVEQRVDHVIEEDSGMRRRRGARDRK